MSEEQTGQEQVEEQEPSVEKMGVGVEEFFSTSFPSEQRVKLLNEGLVMTLEETSEKGDFVTLLFCGGVSVYRTAWEAPEFKDEKGRLDFILAMRDRIVDLAKDAHTFMQLEEAILEVGRGVEADQEVGRELEAMGKEQEQVGQVAGIEA
jgi:hypothetical protein